MIKEIDTQLDVLWAEVVKIKSGRACEYCGKRGTYLNAHHIFSKKNMSVRWCLDNGISLCSQHHTLSSEISAHKTPKKFTDWLIKEKGQKWYNRLRRKSHGFKKWTQLEKENLYAKLLKEKTWLQAQD